MAGDSELIAQALPNYDVGAELGRGGWGVVLGARHRTLGRPVAIKQLPRGFAADPGVRARFVAEAQVLAALSHPHIVPVYDYVESDEMCLLVMEALPGGTVWSRFVEQGFAAETACVVMLAALAGLEAAHRQGVLHRDVKPENLLFSSDGVLKVADFGIAKVVGGGRTVATRAGEILGTPAYIAPEQITGAELTPATDVYAAAVMMYELLAGRLPFPEEGDPIVIVYRHVHEDPVPLRDVAPQIGPQLAAVVMRGLARDVAERYSSAEEFAMAIGTAATADWGPGWQERSGMPLLASPRVLATTRATGLIAPPEGVPATGGTGGAAPARPTVGVNPPPPPPPPGGGATTQPIETEPAVTEPIPAPVEAVAPAAAQTAVVRPEVRQHHQAAKLSDVDPADLVPVEKLVSGRRAALLPGVLALALLVAAFVVGFIGLGSPDRVGDLSPGEVTVAGVDVASTRTIALDLNEDIPVEIAPGTPEVVEVELALSVLGVPLGSDRNTVEGSTTDLVLRGSRYLVAGEVTGELVLHDASGGERTHQFPIESNANGWLTVPGVLCIVAILVVLAFAESLMRSLRRGRKPIAGRTGLVVVGAAFGAVAAAVGWIAGAGEPIVATIAVAAALGAAAGLAAGFAAARLSRRVRRKVAAKNAPSRA